MYPQSHKHPWDTVDFQTYDYVIGGKLVVGHASFSEEYGAMLSPGSDAVYNVKMKLATDLAKYMIENKLVEFTQSRQASDYSTRIAIRAYLAPDEQVKILRLANKIV